MVQQKGAWMKREEEEEENLEREGESERWIQHATWGKKREKLSQFGLGYKPTKLFFFLSLGMLALCNNCHVFQSKSKRGLQFEKWLGGAIKPIFYAYTLDPY